MPRRPPAPDLAQSQFDHTRHFDGRERPGGSPGSLPEVLSDVRPVPQGERAQSVFGRVSSHTLTDVMEPGPLVASGRDSDIFEYGPDLVLRRSREGRSMLQEGRIMEYVR